MEATGYAGDRITHHPPHIKRSYKLTITLSERQLNALEVAMDYYLAQVVVLDNMETVRLIIHIKNYLRDCK